AVSVNGQRIVAQSGITCAGSVITVNGVRVAAPFEIKAIGDASVAGGSAFSRRRCGYPFSLGHCH
ncbi:MAG: DUF881 domain-containing protein, partial [Anaerotignum lactatifermentans]|uniref:DUF881 domain-containing protein n=1 Tax=Anaerotignum lactatifermentans TaxID=160404 RepID=UPI00399BC257